MSSIIERLAKAYDSIPRLINAFTILMICLNSATGLKIWYNLEDKNDYGAFLFLEGTEVLIFHLFMNLLMILVLLLAILSVRNKVYYLGAVFILFACLATADDIGILLPVFLILTMWPFTLLVMRDTFRESNHPHGK